MLKPMVCILLGLFVLTASTVISSDNVSANEIAQRTIQRTRQLKTLTYTMQKTERINGKLVKQVSKNKVSRNPLKVYVKQMAPEEGLEALYVQTSNNAKVLINPNGFPWVNISLAPLSDRMRKGQHHTILDSGYDHFINILDWLLKKYAAEADQMATVSKSITFDGRDCWVITIENGHFRFIDYKVKAGEDVLDIAKRNKVGEHMILENNPKLADYSDVKAGETIKIPNDYSPKMVLYIDKDRMVPLVMKIYDDRGLYELYEYKNVVLDPALKKEEFTPDYPDYGF